MLNCAFCYIELPKASSHNLALKTTLQARPLLILLAKNSTPLCNPRYRWTSNTSFKSIRTQTISLCYLNQQSLTMRYFFRFTPTPSTWSTRPNKATTLSYSQTEYHLPPPSPIIPLHHNRPLKRTVTHLETHMQPALSPLVVQRQASPFTPQTLPLLALFATITRRPLQLQPHHDQHPTMPPLQPPRPHPHRSLSPEIQPLHHVGFYPHLTLQAASHP